MENKDQKRKDMFEYPPHWMRFYKGTDGKTYMQAEFQTDLEFSENSEEAKEFGNALANSLGFPHSDTLTMFNGEALYVDLGAPNQYETQLSERSRQYVPPPEK